MYRWNPEDYSRHSTEQAKWAGELITKLNLEGTERLLDIGCGDGKVTAEIARSLPRGSVVGIDSSPEMIAFAENAFTDKCGNLAFQCVDVRQMTFTREFDIVFSNAALHWVPDHAPVLARVRRSLRPSGKMVLQMGGKGNASAVVEVVSAMVGKERWRRYFHDFSFPYAFYGDDEYAALVDVAGLVLKRVELIPKTMSHKGRAGLSGWVRTTWLPYLQRLPADLQDEFVKELVDEYELRYPPDEEGFLRVGMVRLEVEAVREI